MWQSRRNWTHSDMLSLSSWDHMLSTEEDPFLPVDPDAYESVSTHVVDVECFLATQLMRKIAKPLIPWVHPTYGWIIGITGRHRILLLQSDQRVPTLDLRLTGPDRRITLQLTGLRTRPVTEFSIPWNPNEFISGISYMLGLFYEDVRSDPACDFRKYRVKKKAGGILYPPGTGFAVSPDQTITYCRGHWDYLHENTIQMSKANGTIVEIGRIPFPLLL